MTCGLLFGGYVDMMRNIKSRISMRAAYISIFYNTRPAIFLLEVVFIHGRNRRQLSGGSNDTGQTRDQQIKFVGSVGYTRVQNSIDVEHNRR
jgi:hypothetical protein